MKETQALQKNLYEEKLIDFCNKQIVENVLIFASNFYHTHLHLQRRNFETNSLQCFESERGLYIYSRNSSIIALVVKLIRLN
jgi:hypothetical protein